LAALWEQTGDLRYARMADEQFPARLKQMQDYDKQRKDPLLWSAAMHTQHVLAALREMTFASRAIDAARQTADASTDKRSEAR
jgi:hypothetical protein